MGVSGIGGGGRSSVSPLDADDGIVVGLTADWRGFRDPSTGVIRADRIEVR